MLQLTDMFQGAAAVECVVSGFSMEVCWVLKGYEGMQCLTHRVWRTHEVLPNGAFIRRILACSKLTDPLGRLYGTGRLELGFEAQWPAHWF